MRHLTFKQSWFIGTLMFMLMFFSFIGSASAQEPITLPKTMIWSCYDVGSLGYIEASAVADAFLKKWGIRVRLIPSGTSIGRLMPLVTDRASCAILANETFFAAEGIYDFATYEWGPQNLRVIIAPPMAVGLATAKTAGIKTLKDLKGKRVSWVPGADTLNIKIDAYLAFAGLTWADVRKVEFPSYRASLKALIEGKTDASITVPGAGIMRELESSPKGIHWPEFSPDNKEGWKRMLKVISFFSPYKETMGAGISKEHPVWLCGYRYPLLAVKANADPDWVYNFIKALDVSYPLYKKSHKKLEFWNIERAGVPPADAPFHEGAIKYLKEKGVWKAEHDAWNNDRIEHMNKLQKAWEKALIEGQAKKMKSKDFKNFWLKERAKALAD